MLPRHAPCVFSRLCCNALSLLLGSYLQNWQNRESFLQRLRTLAPGRLSSLSALSSYGLFGDSLFLYDLWSRPWRVAQLLGLDGLPPCPIPGKGLGNNNNSTYFSHTTATYHCGWNAHFAQATNCSLPFSSSINLRLQILDSQIFLLTAGNAEKEI